MNDLIIKICGMREQADLDCAAALGVDLCGFIFAPQSPRAVTPEQAAALDSGDMLRVGVFVTDDMRFIEETARATRLDRIQLHGDQLGPNVSSGYCGQSVIPIWRHWRKP